MSIEIANESSVEVCETTIVSVARYALDKMSVSQLAELSIVIVENDVMADLHERWMDLSGPTDVMAFPMDEYGSSGGPEPGESGAAMLGDIVLCPSFAEEQARKAGHGLAEELHLLTVHGVLHLLGYDHAEPEEEREMFSLQNRLLADFRQARAEAVQHDADSRVLGAVGLEGSSTDDTPRA